jgi:single-stranded DNA-binding protein
MCPARDSREGAKRPAPASTTPAERSLTADSNRRNTQRNNDKDEYDSRTEWHRCTAWGKLAEFAGKLEKGAHVQIEGELRYREYKQDRGSDASAASIKRRLAEIHANRILKLDRAANRTSLLLKATPRTFRPRSPLHEPTNRVSASAETRFHVRHRPTRAEGSAMAPLSSIQQPERNAQFSDQRLLPTQEPPVSPQIAARYLNMHRKTLLQKARKGVLPGHPVGKDRSDGETPSLPASVRSRLPPAVKPYIRSCYAFVDFDPLHSGNSGTPKDLQKG